MPRPRNERQALEQERQELATQLANYQGELDATLPEQRERRERLEWAHSAGEKRMADVEARLVGPSGG